jgi:hypothetical protein
LPCCCCCCCCCCCACCCAFVLLHQAANTIDQSTGSGAGNQLGQVMLQVHTHSISSNSETSSSHNRASMLGNPASCSSVFA